MSKKKENKTNEKKVIESFNNATKEQKGEFVNALEQTLKFNPKKKP